MIAVTGANGLLGSFIIHKLDEANIPFVALKRPGGKFSFHAPFNRNIEWREADILDPISLREALTGVDGVIHTAATVSFNPRHARKVLSVNVEGTKNVVDMALTQGIKRILHVSSVAALGRQKHQNIVTEENKWLDSPLNSVYAESKYRAELEVFRGQEEGLSTVVINPSVILSRGDWNKSSAKIFKYVWDEKPFYADGSINCVDVRDLTDIIVKLYHSAIEGERFIVNGTSTSFKTLLDMTAQRLNCKAPTIKLTRTTLSALAKLENLRSRITGTEPLITSETARFAGATFLYTNEKVKKALGYQFQPIDATLDWCCEFYRNQELKIN